MAVGTGYHVVNGNTGIKLVTEQPGYHAVNANNGVHFDPQGGYHVANCNNIDGHPCPHLWLLAPNFGAAGDGCKIVCWGAGETATQYAATIWHSKPDNSVASVPIVQWTHVDQAPLYGDGRLIDEDTGEIRQLPHQEVTVTIPATAVVPGAFIHIETDTP